MGQKGRVRVPRFCRAPGHGSVTSFYGREEPLSRGATWARLLGTRTCSCCRTPTTASGIVRLLRRAPSSSIPGAPSPWPTPSPNDSNALSLPGPSAPVDGRPVPSPTDDPTLLTSSNRRCRCSLGDFRSVRSTGLLKLRSNVDRAGEPTHTPRRVAHAKRAHTLLRTHLPSPPRPHRAAFAHPLVLHRAAGLSRGRIGHRRRLASPRRSTSTWLDATILGSIETCGQRCAWDGATRSMPAHVVSRAGASGSEGAAAGLTGEHLGGLACRCPAPRHRPHLPREAAHLIVLVAEAMPVAQILVSEAASALKVVAIGL